MYASHNGTALFKLQRIAFQLGLDPVKKAY
jgi:hypothetical protein